MIKFQSRVKKSALPKVKPIGFFEAMQLRFRGMFDGKVGLPRKTPDGDWDAAFIHRKARSKQKGNSSTFKKTVVDYLVGEIKKAYTRIFSLSFCNYYDFLEMQYEPSRHSLYIYGLVLNGFYEISIETGDVLQSFPNLIVLDLLFDKDSKMHCTILDAPFTHDQEVLDSFVSTYTCILTILTDADLTDRHRVLNTSFSHNIPIPTKEQRKPFERQGAILDQEINDIMPPENPINIEI